MQAFAIILLCMFASSAYGILHDQITARVCIEYFTIAHPPVFGGLQDPTLLGLVWGVLATWWHSWKRHFRWDGPSLVGKTGIGRVTISVLEINLAGRVLLRQSLIEEGVFPAPNA